MASGSAAGLSLAATGVTVVFAGAFLDAGLAAGLRVLVALAGAFGSVVFFAAGFLRVAAFGLSVCAA
ncbi:MAG: hypothetical protein HQL47_01620 [Gammaproteobacteria bacterium]|nr:hypothetical protein [Gammaproteobacteria bacterium]